MSNVLLQLDNISFSYGNKPVLTNCTAAVNAQTTTVILGGNGQGKSTLMKCILRYQTCKTGNIFLDGKEIAAYSVKELAKLVSYVPQLNSIINDCVVRDYIVEGRTPYLEGFSLPRKSDYLKAEQYANKLGIDSFLGKHLSHLSGGELQMVMIARALVQETPLILMDEPLSALDMKKQFEILEIIKNLERDGKTILLTTHNPNHAISLNCNVWILDQQRITHIGSADQIITSDLLHEIYSPNVVLFTGDNWKCCGFSEIP